MILLHQPWLLSTQRIYSKECFAQVHASRMSLNFVFSTNPNRSNGAYPPPSDPRVLGTQQEALPPPPPAAPLEAPWRPPPPGFDIRTLRRQASNLRAEGAKALTDQETVRRSSERLAEILAATFENGCENNAAARTHLCRLHFAFRRLKKERLSHEEAVRAAMAWQESAEELKFVTISNDLLQK